jgi:N-terminal domain of lipoyl synthase of Radical_SAM family
MPPVLSRSPLLTCILSPNTSLSLKFVRAFASEIAPPPPQKTQRPATKFSDRLNAGPSLDRFIGDSEAPLTNNEALELKTAMVGPPGKKRKITRLPEWLKTPIPDGENFKKIRNDLRGLNLHTGKFIYLLDYELQNLTPFDQSAKKLDVRTYPNVGEEAQNLLPQLP